MPKYNRIVLKLSGEALAGGGAFGVDPERVKSLAAEIADVAKTGVQIGLVVGGGMFFRGVAAAAMDMDRVAADHMGMLATVINAIALQDALEKVGVPTRVMTAIQMHQVAEPYIRRRAIRHLEKGRIVIFAAGTSNPYFSTDTAATLRALEVHANVIAKGTRVDGVYDKDPLRSPDAVLYKQVSYLEVLAKALAVMDASAVAMCRDNQLPIVVFNLNVFGNIRPTRRRSSWRYYACVKATRGTVRALPRQFYQPAPADHAGLVLVASGALPVRLQAEPALVAISHQRVHLPAPPHHAFADGAPLRLVPVHRAILGMHVLNPRNRQPAVAVGKSPLAGDHRAGRVPDHFQVGMIERRQHARRLLAGGDIARVLVFQADDHIVPRGLVGQRAQGFHDAVEAGFRLHRPPIRKYPDDARPGAPGNLQRPLREPRLIGKRVLGGEHILLEAGIHFQRIRQDALQQRRCDGENLQPRAAHHVDRPVQFFIAQIHDVLAGHHAQFGPRHAESEVLTPADEAHHVDKQAFT